MLRRFLYPYLPERRVWIAHVAALTTAAFVTLVAFLFVGRHLSHRQELKFDTEQHVLPPESVCLVPYPADQKVPAVQDSRLPVIRLREYAPNRYELLYWGNPVRPAYTFSVWALHTGAPALLTADNTPLSYHPLPVTSPRRKDGMLPLQPPVRLKRVKGRSGDLFAARIAVHDAATGTVLASVLYVMSGTE